MGGVSCVVLAGGDVEVEGDVGEKGCVEGTRSAPDLVEAMDIGGAFGWSRTILPASGACPNSGVCDSTRKYQIVTIAPSKKAIAYRYSASLGNRRHGHIYDTRKNSRLGKS